MNIRILRSGFTLIELLVTISIIGILAAIIYANFGDAKEDAKNKVLRAEMKEMQLAIELYKAQNGQYPEPQDINTGGCDTAVGGVSMSAASACGTNPLIKGLVPEFIAALPERTDSANPNCDYQYMSDDDGTWDSDDGTWYKLTATNCIAADSQPKGVQDGDEMARYPNSSSCTYNNMDVNFYQSLAIYSSGGECR